MTPSLVLACLWALAANLMAMMPSCRGHRPQAAALIATGVPLLGWVTYQNGPLVGLLVLGAGMSVLRWPLLRLVHWLRRRPRAQEPAE